ncbi:hypothetical protein [uncultured Brevibacillus sp.]|nr:hypothetical protein [uncultured Brevibacillus sp.]
MGSNTIVSYMQPGSFIKSISDRNQAKVVLFGRNQWTSDLHHLGY